MNILSANTANQEDPNNQSNFGVQTSDAFSVTKAIYILEDVVELLSEYSQPIKDMIQSFNETPAEEAESFLSGKVDLLQNVEGKLKELASKAVNEYSKTKYNYALKLTGELINHCQ